MTIVYNVSLMRDEPVSGRFDSPVFKLDASADAPQRMLQPPYATKHEIAPYITPVQAGAANRSHQVDWHWRLTDPSGSHGSKRLRALLTGVGSLQRHFGLRQ